MYIKDTMPKNDKKKHLPKAKQSGNGNNRDQNKQRRQSLRSQDPDLVQMSDSRKKAVPDNFTTVDDRRAKDKTRTPFQSPAGQQPSKTDKTGSSPTIATKKATEDAIAVVHGVNSQQQQQNRVPDPSSQDPTTVTKTGHVARTTAQSAQSRA